MAMLFVFSSFSTLPTPPGDVSYEQVHVAAYAGLGAVTVRALARGEWRHVTFLVACGAILIASAYGVSDEYHQRFVPGRDFSRMDMLADAIGSALGACGLWAWSIIRRRFKTPDAL
jgi:VanZ family protein